MVHIIRGSHNRYHCNRVNNYIRYKRSKRHRSISNHPMLTKVFPFKRKIQQKSGQKYNHSDGWNSSKLQGVHILNFNKFIINLTLSTFKFLIKISFIILLENQQENSYFFIANNNLLKAIFHPCSDLK